MYKNQSKGGGTPRGKAARQKVTAPALQARKGGDRIVMVTAYDYTMARLMDQGGADAILVGDSLGMVVQGLDTTIPVTLEEVCYHTRAVARGTEHAHVVGDMPFMSFQISPEQALQSAGQLVKEGMAESVKLEGGLEMADHVHRIVSAGIPVMGHVGLTPQSVHALGGFKVQGRAREVAEEIVAGAEALEQAGAYAIVLEAVPPDVAAIVTDRVSVPTIGIGAGAGCDGQVLVCYDMLGMNLGHTPKFAKRYDEVGERIIDAVAQYAREVREGSFPGREHSFKPAGHEELGAPLPADSETKLAVVR
ncbi:MAG: 3-methyl-2-oxobutanoate hydroxymethyltransferase [Deltaproteobacteria bacterium]|jgi:3-methyl-2-oxobutanoate hydroxymethyltransferase|nr:3-methyl-2-oxobutanoate hydroxymethyltransferase [Deltaproteobacteria bacterium]MBW2530144.1 3-methyl-2-oxobutanoate hydroxymethyltransferase [Deltaproteobacteria bacterium]